MKYVLILAALFLTACDGKNPELDESSNQRDFRYLDSVIIQKGFYQGLGCVVLREYTSTIFCKIAYRPEAGVFGAIGEQYQIRVNVPKSIVKKDE